MPLEPPVINAALSATSAPSSSRVISVGSRRRRAAPSAAPCRARCAAARRAACTSRGHLEAGQVLLRVGEDRVGSLRSLPGRGTTNATKRWPNCSSSTPTAATSSDVGVLASDRLDLARVHVLAARDDHVVLARVDEQAALARRRGRGRRRSSSPSRDSRVELVRVALEQHLVPDEDAPVGAGRQPAALVVEDRDPRVGQRRARRCPAPSAGPRESRSSRHESSVEPYRL